MEVTEAAWKNGSQGASRLQNEKRLFSSRHFKSNYVAAVITATCAHSRFKKYKRLLPPPHPLQGQFKFGEGKETERIFKTLGFFELILLKSINIFCTMRRQIKPNTLWGEEVKTPHIGDEK